MNLNSKLSVLFFSSFLSLTAWAEGRPGGEDCARIEPTPAQYSMIHPFHLPHVLRFIKDNGVDFRIEGSQQQAIDRLAADVRGPTQSRQAEAGKLEREITVAAFDGLDSRAQTERFDRLQRAKREIAEIHVDFVNRLRSILSPGQFALLRKLADR